MTSALFFSAEKAQTIMAAERLDADAVAGSGWRVVTLLGALADEAADSDAAPAGFNGFAQLNRIAFDVAANRLFVCDQHRIRMVTLAEAKSADTADDDAAAAAAAATADGGTAPAPPPPDYSAPPRVDSVTTLAGSADASGCVDGGPQHTASPHTRLCSPAGLAFDHTTGQLYVADSGNRCVRRLHVPTRALVTLKHTAAPPAAANAGAAATDTDPFALLSGLCWDARGHRLFACDQATGAVRAVSLYHGHAVTTLRSPTGTADEAKHAARDGEPLAFAAPMDAAVVVNADDDGREQLWVCELDAHRIRRVLLDAPPSPAAAAANATDDTLATAPAVAVVCGAPPHPKTGRPQPFRDGPRATGTLLQPVGLAYDPLLRVAFVADSGHNRIRVVDRTGAVATVAGDGEPQSRDTAADDPDPTAASCSFSGADSIALDPTSGRVYVASDNRLRVLLPPPRIVAARAVALQRLREAARRPTALRSLAAVAADGASANAVVSAAGGAAPTATAAVAPGAPAPLAAEATAAASMAVSAAAAAAVPPPDVGASPPAVVGATSNDVVALRATVNTLSDRVRRLEDTVARQSEQLAQIMPVLQLARRLQPTLFASLTGAGR